jgi:hypothetical protein
MHDNTILDDAFCSDKAWFLINGYVNSQNSTVRSAEKPHQYCKFHYMVKKEASGVQNCPKE